MAKRRVVNLPPAFQFYAGDWLASTKIAMMSPAQEGAYIRLLAYAWKDPDCSIPNDDQQLAALSRLGSFWFEGGSTLVRACFTECATDPTRLVNKRLLEARAKMDDWKRKSAKGGRNSGDTRRLRGTPKANHTSTNGATKNGTIVEPNTNTSSLSSSSNSNTSSIIDPQVDLSKQSAPVLPNAQCHAEMIPIPDSLDTPEFRSVWFERWIPYLRRAKDGRLYQDSLQSQLAMLSRAGPAAAIASIELSIRSTWTYLKDPNEQRTSKQPAVGAGQRYDPNAIVNFE